jgi:lipopolysaccharide transport system permease protein
MKTVITSNDRSSISFSELKRYGGLFKYLSLRDVMVRYKQTWAGASWAIIRPLINVVIFGCLSLLITRPEDYATRFLEVACGIVMWQLIATAVQEISNSLVNNANILTKVYFPKILLPASSLLVCLIDFALSFLIFLVAFVLLKGPPPVQVFLFPLYILLALLFCFSAGLFFATLNVRYRDIKFMLPFFIQIVFYVSPVFLSTGFFMGLNVPQLFKTIYLLNPVVSIMDGFKFCFFGGAPFASLPLFLGSMGIVVLTLWLSIRYFLRFEKSFADYI